MSTKLKYTALYLGIAFLFSHELDAVKNHEWRIIPGLNLLSEEVGETLFLLFHIPLYTLVIASVASLNMERRDRAGLVICSFFVAHAVAHYLFSEMPAYEFSSLVSDILILGAAISGVAYFVLNQMGRNTKA